jgi:polysaccharide export outer membrane protein
MALLVLAFFLAFGATDASAQTGRGTARAPAAPPKTTAPAPARATPPPAQSTTPPPGYRVGPQDVLTITVYGEPQLSGKFRVDNDGSFPFQYLGRVKADDLTVGEIESALKRGLADGYLKNPQLSVEVDQYHSQNVFVMGEVRSPNKYALPGNSTLMDVLTLAGSVTSNAGHWVLINHGRQGLGPSTMEDASMADLKVNLRDIQSGKAQNIKIQDGDTIYVPKAERIFVTGQVRTPGAFTFDDDMTVFTAISLAGGLTEKGSNSRITIIRLENGKRKETDAKQTDILKAGDNVYVKPRRL